MKTTLVASIAVSDERVWYCCWSPNGKFIATCGEDKIIRIWALDLNIFAIRVFATLEEAQSRTIRCCAWSPNGKFIASASFDGTVVVWQSMDSSYSRWEQVAQLEGHENEVKVISWSHCGEFLATCGRDKKIWIWENINNEGDFECCAILDGHTQDVKHVVWHPLSNVLFSSSYDDSVKVWISDGGDWYCATTLVGHSSTVWSTAPNSDGTKIVSCSDDKSVILWENVSNTSWFQVARLKDLHTCPVYAIDWNQSTNMIATGGGDNAIKLLSYSKADDGSGILAVEWSEANAHDGDVNCVKWNNSVELSTSDMLASVGDDGILKVWRIT